MMRIALIALVATASVHGQAINSICGSLSGPTSCATGDDVFLRTSKIELGIHPAASFGSITDVPSSFAYSAWCSAVPFAATCRLGFICDYDDNGLTTGSPPFSGDYFVPGSPVEGWTIQYTKADSSTPRFTNAGLEGSFAITPTSISITSDDTNAQSSVWTGQTAEVSIRATTTVPYEKKLFYVDTCITNISPEPITDLYYMRNIDPDQQQPWNGNFNTYNYVQYQPASFGYSSYVNSANPNMAAVIARGDDGGYENFVLALGAVDPRAFASHGGFYNTDPVAYYNNDNLWQGYGGNWVPLSDTAHMRYADEGINLVFKHGALAPREETCFRTYFGLSTDFEADIISEEGCVDLDAQVNCDTIQQLGLCEHNIPGSDAPLSSICPLSCGCCDIDGKCVCDDNAAVADAFGCFGIKGGNCKILKRMFGCRNRWLGAFINRHCPCLCRSEAIPIDPIDVPRFS